MSEQVHREHREITEITEINLLIRDFTTESAEGTEKRGTFDS